MRPPHYTGENPNRGRPPPIEPARFNEAPALHGGKRGQLGRGRERRAIRFNEAPALHGGKRDAPPLPRADVRASMRPPHYTGENADCLSTFVFGFDALQ